MLRGQFENCYGLKKFELKEIDFTTSNKAIIYAPNGVMKTSFANTIEVIKSGKTPEDRIFRKESKFNLEYMSKTCNSNSTEQELKDMNVFVIHSFVESKEAKESISTLLVDKTLKEEYENILKSIDSETKEIISRLSSKSSISKNKIKETILSDFGLSQDTEWLQFFKYITPQLATFSKNNDLAVLEYSTIINPKTIELFQDSNFKKNIEKYIEILKCLVDKSTFLSSNFDDYKADQLGKSFTKFDLFTADHQILLKDGSSIRSRQEWEQRFKTEISRIESDPSLKKVYNDINKLLNKNAETLALKDIINSNPLIIRYFDNLDEIKTLIWKSYLIDLKDEVQQMVSKYDSYEKRLKEIVAMANQTKAVWEKIVDDFNNRFMVPFKIMIKNQANVLLKDETPSIVFEYEQCGEKVEKMQNELMKVLSMGEKRSLYLLQILFDVEKLKAIATSSGERHLIIVDDIADSFDYKNKFAIIEYLKEISDFSHFDLLLLTHNFDFYRTVSSRIGVTREGSFIVQKREDDTLTMEKFGYKQDVFKKMVVDSLADGDVEKNRSRYKWFFASIPFFRNISDYTGNSSAYDFLTELLHIKGRTEVITVTELWSVYKTIIQLQDLKIADPTKTVYTALSEVADEISQVPIEEVNLENKIILSISIRLEAELLMKKLYSRHGLTLPVPRSNQTREWFDGIKHKLTNDERTLLEQVNMVTPENIHVNAFMYEPIIDLSDWHLKKLGENLNNLIFRCRTSPNFEFTK